MEQLPHLRKVMIGLESCRAMGRAVRYFVLGYAHLLKYQLRFPKHNSYSLVEQVLSLVKYIEVMIEVLIPQKQEVQHLDYIVEQAVRDPLEQRLDMKVVGWAKRQRAHHSF